MEKTRERSERKSLGKPEEVREFLRGKIELVTLGGATVGRATFLPGWRWSTSLKPIAKTASCEAPHFQLHLSGTLMVKTDDGKAFECRAGDVSAFTAGHDAWVVGSEPVVVVDFQGLRDYAKTH